MLRELFMNDISEKYILEKLVTKYERSVLYRKGTDLNLKIKIKIRQLYPKYDASDYYQNRLKIDFIAEKLSKQGLINVDYVGEDIDSVTLRLGDDELKETYRIIDRPFNRDNEKIAINYLKTREIEKDWIKIFIDDMIDQLTDHKSIIHYLPIDNQNDLTDILKILDNLCNQDEEISMRKLSLKLFNDSKRFESLKGRVVNIVTDYYHEEFEDEEELLAYFNVIKNPGFIYLSGNIVIEINGQTIDVGKLEGPFSLVTANITKMNIIEIKDKNVVTVENLTSFYDLKIEDSLIIYLGGYHNALRRKLLTNIFEYNKKLNFYHFGDIDAGGFYIYLHLIEKTGIPFKRLAMNKDILVKYLKYCKKLTVNDRKKLSILNDVISDGTIDYMLEHNVKLEQEIVEIDKI